MLFALRRIDFSAVTVKAEGEQKAGKHVFSIWYILRKIYNCKVEFIVKQKYVFNHNSELSNIIKKTSYFQKAAEDYPIITTTIFPNKQTISHRDKS